VLHCVAVCVAQFVPGLHDFEISVLQHVAACCSALLCVSPFVPGLYDFNAGVLQCAAAVCRGLLQFVAVPAISTSHAARLVIFFFFKSNITLMILKNEKLLYI